LATGYLLAAFLNMFIGRLSDRIGRRTPTLVGLAIATVLLPSLPIFNSLSVLALVSVIAAAAVSALWTPTAAMVSDGSEVGASGQAVGVATMNAAWAAGGAVGPILEARLAEAAGFNLPFALAGGLCAASALLLLLTYRRQQETRRVIDEAPAATPR